MGIIKMLLALVVDSGTIQRRRVKYMLRHTIGSGLISVNEMKRCWKWSKLIIF